MKRKANRHKFDLRRDEQTRKRPYRGVFAGFIAALCLLTPIGGFTAYDLLFLCWCAGMLTTLLAWGVWERYGW